MKVLNKKIALGQKWAGFVAYPGDLTASGRGTDMHEAAAESRARRASREGGSGLRSKTLQQGIESTDSQTRSSANNEFEATLKVAICRGVATTAQVFEIMFSFRLVCGNVFDQTQSK